MLLLAAPTAALAANEMLVHRDPGCGCCAKWAVHLREETGRPVKMVDDPQRQKFQEQYGIPAALGSCHTAVIDGLAFEGHVPARDIKRLLAERPKGIKGLAVAGMPLGSPGMEVSGMRAQPYQVIAFGPGGQQVYARYGP